MLLKRPDNTFCLVFFGLYIALCTDGVNKIVTDVQFNITNNKQ